MHQVAKEVYELASKSIDCPKKLVEDQAKILKILAEFGGDPYLKTAEGSTVQSLTVAYPEIQGDITKAVAWHKKQNEKKRKLKEEAERKKQQNAKKVAKKKRKRKRRKPGEELEEYLEPQVVGLVKEDGVPYAFNDTDGVDVGSRKKKRKRKKKLSESE